MEITKCEFCNAYIKNFEVHNCMTVGNQLRQTSATLHQCSSGNVAEDIELIKAVEMEDEALWPFEKQSDSSTLNQINQPLNQINNSWQQSISSDIHQGIDCEETTTAEMASQYEDPNQNSYIPSDYETEHSDYLFPEMRYIQENDVLSTHLQLPPEVSNAIINQNPQNFESSNSEHPEDTPMSVATPCVSPGFQQTFDLRNSISYATHPNESSVNCEKYSKDQSLGGAACASQNMDAPQETKNPPYESSKCPMQFERKECLESQERCHNVKKTYVCSFCDKTFTRSDYLGKHILTHTGERPYKCTFCEKAFTQCSTRNAHIRSHSGEKPHSCAECSKSFARSSDLKRHIRSIHRHEKPYSCNQCDICFADSGNLSKHVSRIHTGESPYASNKCNKRYSKNSDPKHHLLKHASEERSKCDSCGEEFSSEDSLEAHHFRKNK